MTDLAGKAPEKAPEGGFKPALLLMTGRAVGFAATLFIPVVLVRIFDPTGFGTYKQVFLVFATLYSLAQVGMAESLFYFLPSARRDPERYVVNAILVLAAAGLVCLLLLGAGASQFSRALGNPELAGYLAPVGLYLMLMVTSAVLEIAMISRKRYLGASASYAVSDILRAAFIVAPAFLFGRVEAVLAGVIALAALRCCAALIYLRREFNGSLRPDAALLREQLGYALPFQMAVLLDTVHSNFHQYAVSHYFDAATFAIYSVGCLQIPLVDFVATPASNVMMVRMGERLREGQKAAVLRLWHDTTRKLGLVFLPLSGFLVLVSRELITFLFTARYEASVPIFVVWLATLPLAVLQVDGVLRAHARTRALLMLNGLRLLLVFGLMSWSLSRLGPLGAVGVTIVGLAFFKVLALVRIKRLLGVGLPRLLPWNDLATILAATALAGLPVLALKALLGGTTLPFLAAAGMTYAVFYLAMVIRFGSLEGAARLGAAGWIRRLMPRPARPEESRG